MFFIKKLTLANIGRLDNEKSCKIDKKKTNIYFFFHSPLLQKRSVDRLCVAVGVQIENTKNNVAFF